MMVTWDDNGGGITTPQWTASEAMLPEIAVFQGSDNTGTELFTGQPIPVNYGYTPSAVILPMEFAIENTGIVDMNITDITTTGDFAVATSTSFTVAPGATANFTVNLLPLAPGIANGTVDY